MAIGLPNDFSDIGFAIADRRQYRDLANLVVAEGSETPLSSGSLHHWVDPSGAEIWVQQDADGDVGMVEPFFEGASTMPVLITTGVQDKPGSSLEGRYQGWAASSPGSNYGAYPIVFACPDFHRQPEIALPAHVTVHMTAFARMLNVFADEQALAASQVPGKGALASKHFIPTGITNPGGEPFETVQPLALMGGYVTASGVRCNTLSGRQFYVLEVASYEADYTVVLDPAYAAAPPAVGSIVAGGFYLVGRLVDADALV